MRRLELKKTVTGKPGPSEDVPQLAHRKKTPVPELKSTPRPSDQFEGNAAAEQQASQIHSGEFANQKIICIKGPERRKYESLKTILAKDTQAPPPNERPKRPKVETESEYYDATMVPEFSDNKNIGRDSESGLPPCPLHPWMPQTIPTIPTAPAVPAVIPPYRPPVIAPYSVVPQISPYTGISQFSTYTGIPQVATNLGSYYANLGSSVGAVRSTCMDTHEKCAIWASTGQCSLNVVAMRRLCPVSCGTCLSGSTIGTVGSVGSAIGTYPSMAYVAQPAPIVTSNAYNYPYPYTGSIYTGRSIYENNVLRSPTIKSLITPIAKDLNSEVSKNNKKFFY
ncbi:hypothetical protein WR25_05477 [Diploscapter pachys]|uniref:ShKT domain-containing protein n=1 Tax=Diploscapter pachys TaxID=2018661 RepID=A0A2A2LWP1_9BILA|nr:hypothetical protein WR25_05477 [Diploscapter pachys]